MDRQRLDNFRFKNGYDYYYHNIYTAKEKLLLKQQMEIRLNSRIVLTREDKINIEKNFIEFL